jgi:predicted CoA-binding protein
MKPATLVLGASENEERYSNKAIKKLLLHHYPVIAIGQRAGEVNGVTIQTGMPIIESVDTVTLYIGPQNQPPFYNYLMALKPRRIIFNPGTENQELITLAHENNIITEEACTLVLLSTDQY